MNFLLFEELLQEFQEPGKKKMVHVCASTDKENMLGVMAMVNSVTQNTEAKVHFHILCTSEIQQHLR